MRKKRILGIVLTSVLALGMLTGCGNSKTADTETKEVISIKHNGGETEVPKNPEKVVVLDYGSLDILDRLDVKVIGVPQNNLPSYLDKYKSADYVNVGGIKEFNLETVNEIGPDLIIIEGRQEDSYDELSKIAPTIYLGSLNTDHFEGVKENVTTLGKIFDKEDVADKELNNIQERLNAIKEKVESENLNALVTMVTDGSMSVYGAGSRYNSIYENFGFKPADENIEVNKHGQSISYEYLAKKNPDYLFVIDKGVITGSEAQPAKDIVENDLVKTTDTYKNGHIVYLDAQAWYVGGQGLQSTEKMISDIENALK